MFQLLIAFKMTRSAKKIMGSNRYLHFEFSAFSIANPEPLDFHYCYYFVGVLCKRMEIIYWEGFLGGGFNGRFFIGGRFTRMFFRGTGA